MRETVRTMREEVTAKCYGGDVLRKHKLLEKQNSVKKMRQPLTKVELSSGEFIAALKMYR